MKKIMKRLVALALVSVCVLITVTGCGSSDTSSKQGKSAKIGVALYQDAGGAVTAVKSYLSSLEEGLNVEFTYTVLSQMDEATNLTKIQELISSGVDGIICTMDLGMTSIIKECEDAGVYIGGYLSDYDTSFNSAYDKVFKNDYFVGTAADGKTPEEVDGGTVMFESLMEYNEANPDAPITHVSMVIFPSWAFPTQGTASTQFIAAIDEYNKTASTPITVDPLNEETDVLPFSPLDSTYFQKHPGIQAIMSFAAGTAFVYPTMVSAGVDSDIRLFTSGYEGGEDVNFGTSGTKTYQQLIFTQVESITFPLVLILNKINEATYSDQPETAERVSSSPIILNSDDDMNIFKEKSIYYKGEASKAMFTAEEVLDMTAYANEKATYAKLKEILSRMTIEDIAQ